MAQEDLVRLGLVLAEIGEKNGITISEDELSRGVADRARQFPGREQEVWDHYRNNPQALATVRDFVPEVLILDLGMPDVDGYAVARAVRADPALARTRLIALSGYGQAEDLRRTREAGFRETRVEHLIGPDSMVVGIK